MTARRADSDVDVDLAAAICRDKRDSCCWLLAAFF